MAEIRVEPTRNKHNSFWPWILGALLIIGLIWGATELLEDDDREIEATRMEQTIEGDETMEVESENVNNEEYLEEEPIEDEAVLEEQ